MPIMSRQLKTVVSPSYSICSYDSLLRSKCSIFHDILSTFQFFLCEKFQKFELFELFELFIENDAMVKYSIYGVKG